MSTGYVMPDISREQVLQAAFKVDDIVVLDHGEEGYELSMPIDPQYSLNKRIKLSKVLNFPPDNVQQGTNKASILLLKTPDEINSWFWGTATSINHPELILDTLAEILEVYWLSEHNDEYWDYS